MLHQKNVSCPKHSAIVNEKLPRLRSNLQKSGELVRHSIYDRSPVVAKRALGN